MMQQYHNPVQTKGRDILRGGRMAFFGVLLFLAGVLSGFAQTITFTTSPYEPGENKAKGTRWIAYEYNAKAEANDGSPVQYTLRFGPTGMKVGKESGTVWWNPSSLGEVEVEIEAHLMNNPSISVTQRWTVSVENLSEHPECTGRDYWLSPGEGVSGYVNGATVVNGELYVYHKRDRYRIYESNYSAVSKWNGSKWTRVLDTEISWSDLQCKMIEFQGDLYATSSDGRIHQFGIGADQLTYQALIYDPYVLRNIIQMEVHNNALYALGIGYRALGDAVDVNRVMKWDGKAWSKVFETDKDSPIRFAQVNGKLYLSGRFATLAGSGDVPTLAEIVDDQIAAVPNAPTDPIVDIIPHNGGLVLQYGKSADRLEFWTPASLIPLPPNPYVNKAERLLDPLFSHAGELYMSARYILPEPTSDSNIYVTELWRLSGGEWVPVSALKGEPAVFTGRIYNLEELPPHYVTYKGDLYVLGWYKNSCEGSLSNVARLCKDGECSKVSGIVFHDDDRDCIQSSGENSLARERVEFQPGSYFATTNSNGEFSAILPSGVYTATLLQKRYWIGTCGDQQVMLSNRDAFVDNISLGTDMIPGIQDVRVSLLSSRARPGEELVYTLLYQNVGTEPATGKVWVDFDDRLTFKSATVSPARQNGNHLEWDFANLQVGEQVQIHITTVIPTSIALGEELCATSGVELEKRDDDRLLSDNEDSTCTTVRASFDPNDIQVLPHNALGELGEETLSPNDTILTYIVQFQNTGNDTAFKVVVVDTISHYTLDVPSIELGASSHPYTFSISGQGVLTWTFDNIMLPDSGANQLASNGYFKYRVHLKRGLSPRTEIANRASIYFDYNVPVLTNQVVSITSGTLSVGVEELASSMLRVYPNPTRGLSMISLQLAERSDVRIRLVDSKGSLLQTLVEGALGVGEHQIKLETSSLASGLYFITLERGGEKEVFPVVVGR